MPRNRKREQRGHTRGRRSHASRRPKRCGRGRRALESSGADVADQAAIRGGVEASGLWSSRRSSRFLSDSALWRTRPPSSPHSGRRDAEQDALAALRPASLRVDQLAGRCLREAEGRRDHAQGARSRLK